MRDKLIVLDIDETLLFTSSLSEVDERMADHRTDEWSVYYRPFAKEFLQWLAEHPKLAYGFFTKAHEDYAREVLSPILPKNKDPLFLFSHEKMVQRHDSSGKQKLMRSLGGGLAEPVMVKDLAKVVRKTGYSLADILAVDDIPEMYSRQYGNLIHVTPYSQKNHAQEILRPLLKDLQDYLAALITVDDVRAIEKRGWPHSSHVERISDRNS